jgi:lipopolysaccharide/colanic/teichoic acid biosynthesis glycosyltransferase
MKRLFDILASYFGLMFFLPFLTIVGILIVIDSKGGVFYRQVRVGMGNKDFRIFKFRTMRPDSDKAGLLTVGAKDNRITKIGVFLRKYKIDEFPQLLNVLIGDMSIVGPRPEVRKYVDMYNAEQLRVLEVRPGITDYASIEYSNENELLKTI